MKLFRVELLKNLKWNKNKIYLLFKALIIIMYEYDIYIWLLYKRFKYWM